MWIKTFFEAKRRNRRRCLQSFTGQIRPMVERVHGHVLTTFHPQGGRFKKAELWMTQESWDDFKERVDEQFGRMS